MRNLRRVKKDLRIAGVCAGLGDYFRIDAAVFRIIFVGLSLLWGMGIILYLMAIALIPRQKDVSGETDKNCSSNAESQ